MARRNVDEMLQRDQVVDIPRQHRRRFGGAARMLKPSRRGVETVVRKIPCGKIMTTTVLRAILAERHGAEVTCPFLTKRALMAIAEDEGSTAPFWRVVMVGGEMISAYPGGAMAQSKRLREEGVAIVDRGKPKVQDLAASVQRSRS